MKGWRKITSENLTLLSQKLEVFGCHLSWNEKAAVAKGTLPRRPIAALMAASADIAKAPLKF